MERRGGLEPSLRRAWIDGEVPCVECGGQSEGSSQNQVALLFPPFLALLRYN